MAKRRWSKKRGRKSRRRPLTKRHSRRRTLKQPQQYFTRTLYLPGYYSLSGGGVATGAAMSFSLGALPGSADFATLYDMYKIKAVKLSLIPRHTETALGSSLQANMWSTIDYDDVNVPTSLDDMLQVPNIRRTRMNQVHSRYFRPTVKYDIAAGTQSAPKRNTWLDMSNVNTPHYGVKFWFDARGTAAVVYDVQIKLYMAFKNVR